MNQTWRIVDCGKPLPLTGVNSRFTIEDKNGHVVAYAFDRVEARIAEQAPRMLIQLAKLMNHPCFDKIPTINKRDIRSIVSRARGGL